MNMPFEEPTLPPISPRAQRVLVAGWISLGLHAALIALVQVAPPAPVSLGETVIEARLVSRQAASVAAVQPPATGANPPEVPTETPRLVPSEAVDMLPVARPQVALPPDVPPAPAPAPADPVASAEPAVAVPPPAPAPATAITSAVDLTYYSARDVDVHPRALHEVIPVYPADADRRRVSGKLRLQLKLQADGRVSDLEVLSASPPGVFDESALQAFRTARFAPAQKNGRPVRALVQIEVVYDWAGQDRR
ncbi:energy transducer TonB [Thiobacillus sp.]|uniref:energy transducer TonB n=1 Tax=Thiobacillus sp. TaxID=924 RepID=UPI0025FF8359|nr:energy transducer TonB [Thiobacillus sp.]MBT9539959.1 TonB family protein [Thiobacillus sp.]MBT9540878.1 TonB family protein [Thiobacillus sp.]